MTIDMNFLGEVVMFAGNYAPAGWAFCDGQLLQVQEYSALYSVIGTTYGGDGYTTFALPNLKSRFPRHRDSGYPQGQMGGTNQIILQETNLPPHTHTIKASTNAADQIDPTNHVQAKVKDRSEISGYSAAENLVDMSHESVSTTGAGQAIYNDPLYTTMNFIICLDGMYPSRN